MEKDAEQRILAQSIAKQDGAKIQGTSIGYSISLLMDYGNGRQVTLSGTLPLGATKEDFDKELDKLRLATNRQQAFVIIRDREARQAVAEKMLAATDAMIAEYIKESDKEIERMGNNPATKGHTLIKQQVENMRSQVTNFKQQNNQERQQYLGEIESCKVIIANARKEVEEVK